MARRSHIIRMTKKHRWIAPLLISISASALLTSCLVPGYAEGGRYLTAARGVTVYTTLPDTFTGNAYYHNGRYYSGGNYQTGRYHDHGRSYGDRYYHNGRYYYGGEYQQHTAKPERHDSRHDYGRDRDRSNRRDAPGSLRPFNRTRGQMPAVQSRYY
jgi:hypothetical protein